MVEAGCSCAGEIEIATTCAERIERTAMMLRRHFVRPEAYRHAVDYLRGLIAEIERKNGWQLAEYAGYVHPRGMQRVLDRYAWDAEAVRDDLQTYVIAELGDPSGVLVVDETGFPKQGKHSVGVAPQYCGTLGKIANCQTGVLLGYASPKGNVGIDRALFVPEEWFADRQRCEEAGIPKEIPFQTKPQLALALLERAFRAGVPAAWVVADEVYGSAGKLRRALEERGQAYVLAVRSNQTTSTWPPYGPPGQVTIADVAAVVAADAWHRRSCGEGAQGPRIYDWAYVPVRPALRAGWVHGVLVRRHPVRTQELAYYLVYARRTASLASIVRAAGTRWTIEATIQFAKGQVGLDQYEVRSWQGWYRHITLALLALAALAVGAKEKGASVLSISRLPSQKSAGSWSGSSGRRPARPRTSRPGRVGAVIIRKSRKPVINAAA